MANKGFDLVAFKVTSSSATGAFHDLSQYIIDWDGFEILAETEETHTMGDAWTEESFTGLRRVSPLKISGLYDDVAASGPHALFGNTTDLGAERVIKVNFGTTNAYPKVDVIVKRYSRKPSRGALTKYEVELIPTGAVTVVTT